MMKDSHMIENHIKLQSKFCEKNSALVKLDGCCILTVHMIWAKAVTKEISPVRKSTGKAHFLIKWQIYIPKFTYSEFR